MRLTDEQRESWAAALTCSQCGQRLAERACGPTHAVLKADPTQHRMYVPDPDEVTE